MDKLSFATENPVPEIDTKIRISKNELVDLGNFKPEDVDLESISRSLNNIKRFTGHYAFSRPLSVAQHTYLCTMIADRLYPKDYGVKLMCIIHDFPEAYYGDLSSPLKRFLGDGYRDKIKDIDHTVYTKLWKYSKYRGGTEDTFGEWVDTDYNEYKDQCKMCDHISLRIEQNMLFGTFPPEDYVRDFMQKHDTKQMFNKCGEFEIDLKAMYETYRK